MLKFEKHINRDGIGFTTIIVDINGLQKPNKFGRDVFMYSIQFDQINGVILPYGIGIIYGIYKHTDFSRDELMNMDDSRSCSKSGFYCAAVILKDSWNIENDYPW